MKDRWMLTMTELVKVADINKAHKNPIAELVQIACKFDSHIEIEGEGKNINAKSLMGIMAFGLKEGIEKLQLLAVMRVMPPMQLGTF